MGSSWRGDVRFLLMFVLLLRGGQKFVCAPACDQAKRRENLCVTTRIFHGFSVRGLSEWQRQKPGIDTFACYQRVSGDAYVPVGTWLFTLCSVYCIFYSPPRNTAEVKSSFGSFDVGK